MSVCIGVAEMHSYGAVQIEGENDTTAILIRKILEKNRSSSSHRCNSKEVQHPPGRDVTQYIMDYLPPIPDDVPEAARTLAW
jgi:hypothetical protein